MNSKRRVFFSLVLLAIFSVKLSGQEIRVENTAAYVGSGRYEWTVFLDAHESVLDRIAYVEYTLHPTFPDPIRRIHDRTTRFALSSNGWGEFNILVKVVHRNGTHAYLEHWLRLGKKPTEYAKEKTPSSHGKITTGNRSKRTGEYRWEWTVFIVADDETLNEVECIEYTLHPTFPNPVQMVCQRGDVPGMGFFFHASGWGTFTIRVKVLFKNGAVRYLEHPLEFVD